MSDFENEPEGVGTSAPATANLACLAEVGVAASGPVMLDVGKLLATRLLIQAGSGGGKSWLLRRLLEQTHHMVRQIVFDPEGELVTLAEKFDFTVCAPDSETAPIHPEGGAAAARAIYHSRRSAILSLSEFELEEMHDFVADFCRELLRMPQEAWDHLLIAFDEAQLFAPQHDKASSKKALIDLARRGRKRGICLLCATQRLSELSKGVAGQLENKLIGLTTLDVDIARAAEVLGMRPLNARDVLRKLQPGRFIAFGPALGYDLDEVTVGPVASRHAILGTFSGVRTGAALSHEDLAASLRRTAAAATVPPTEPGDGTAPSALSQEQLRLAVIGFAFAHGVDAVEAQFDSARNVVRQWVREGQDEDSRPSDSNVGREASEGHREGTAMASRKRSKRSRRLDALPPRQRLDHLFSSAAAVLSGTSFEELARCHGRKEGSARRWFEMALSHVSLRRLGLAADRISLHRLRPHADRILPALKRAIDKEKAKVPPRRRREARNAAPER